MTRCAAVVFVGLTLFGADVRAEQIDLAKVAATVRRVADRTLTHPASLDPRHWAMAPLYQGLIDVALVMGWPEYLAAVIRTGEEVAWQLGPNKYHADDHAVGHAWLRLYLLNPTNDKRLLPTKRRFDDILENPIKESLSFSAPATLGVSRTDRWTWADALFMAPPTMGLLWQATRQKHYLTFADDEFKASYEALYDPAESLFFRDTRFIEARAPNGQRVFWSRGNGWVYAGLAQYIAALPDDWPQRPFYVDLFVRMSSAVASTQQPDGFWYPSLKDADHVAMPEASGTALFLYGMLRGVRHGLLDRKIYGPVISRAWSALETAVQPDGRVGLVQPPAAGPDLFDADSDQPYGAGTVLMVGAEMLHVTADSLLTNKETEVLAESERLAPFMRTLSRLRER